ncbi:MAG: zinc-binding dehydrogenase [Candidatus Eisenbacteria bacterium]|nr:zinc-binding dehydrogenase [Candidatus Eisenbacteria bacterium]
MRSWKIVEHGPPSVLRVVEGPEAAPGPGQVLLRIDAVGLNHLDLWVRRGVSGHRFPLPLVPGSDIAATIERVGSSVEGWRPGDEVLLAPASGCGDCASCLGGADHLCARYEILGETTDGGCRERMVAPAASLMRRPPHLSAEEAASIPLSLLTAWHMIVDRARLRSGETVLVQAAGSGVGVMAIQIARRMGVRVLATAGNAEKAKKARRLGADEVILYRETDFLDEVRRLTNRRGVDVVIEHVGAETWDRSMRALVKGGRLVICGATSGPHVTLDLRRLFFKGLSLLGSTMGSRSEMDEALRHVEPGGISPVLDRVFRMEDLPDAHAYLEGRSAFGKVVVRGFGR